MTLYHSDVGNLVILAKSTQREVVASNHHPRGVLPDQQCQFRVKGTGHVNWDQGVMPTSKSRRELLILETPAQLASVHEDDDVLALLGPHCREQHVLEEWKIDIVRAENGGIVAPALELLQQCERLRHRVRPLARAPGL